jgi:hypothetical protein
MTKEEEIEYEKMATLINNINKQLGLSKVETRVIAGSSREEGERLIEERRAKESKPAFLSKNYRTTKTNGGLGDFDVFATIDLLGWFIGVTIYKNYDTDKVAKLINKTAATVECALSPKCYP